MSEGVRIDANDNASTSVSKPTSMMWPYPADRRLDQLVELANGAGANVRRNELAAALVAAAPADPGELLRIVISWRTKLVRDVVLGIEEAAQIVTIERHPPGRRRATN